MSSRAFPIALLCLILASSLLSSSAWGVSAAPEQTASQGSAPGLEVAVASPSIPADGALYPVVYVGLVSSAGGPLVAQTDVRVTVTSSMPAFGTVESPLVIPRGQTHAVASFRSTTSPGSTQITASNSGYVPGQGNITTADLPMAGLLTASVSQPFALTAIKVSLNVTTGSYPLQLANVDWSQGSNQLTLINGTNTTDRYGTAYAYLYFNDAGNKTVTATVQKAGYGQASFTLKLTVKPRPLSVVLIPTNIYLNATEPTDILARVLSQGKPLANVQITWSSDLGAVTPPSSTTDSSGSATVSFVSPTNGTADVQASVSLPGYAQTQQTVKITVVASGMQGGGAPLLLEGTLPYVLVAAVVALLLVVLVRRRRRRGEAKAEATERREKAEEAEEAEEAEIE
ncbi:MAG: Ig-like domain-containing protein [Nitrososphaerales archaeon]|nr:Ig-like domain-containing protein [Nitrososphaerales archaeon]